MARSNWKGYISFGLVNIPILLFNSEEPASTLSFKQIDLKTGNQIKYKRIDAETGKEVPWEQIGKGYVYSKDVIVPMEKGALERVAGENARTIAIEEFIASENISPINIDRTYYLVPEKKGLKGYIILREALKRTNKIGIAKVIISTKEYLAAVAIYKHALVLYLLRYAAEIRDLSDLDVPSDDFKKYQVSTKEIEVAKKLISAMTMAWKPEKFKDEYQEAVKQWVNDKVNHMPETSMKPRSHQVKQKTKVVNFIDLLKQSLQSSKTNRRKKKPLVGKRKPTSAAHKIATRH